MGGSGPGNWAYVTATRENTYGIKQNGSLWAWGRNTYSMLLQGAGGLTHDFNKGYSPVPIIGTGYNDYDWSTVETEFARANYGGTWMKNDGSLWSWGENDYGQLGDGTNTDRYSPTRISDFGNNRTAVSVSSGREHTCAILDDGSVRQAFLFEKSERGGLYKTRLMSDDSLLRFYFKTNVSGFSNSSPYVVDESSKDYLKISSTDAAGNVLTKIYYFDSPNTL